MTEPSPKKKGSSKPGEGKRASDNFRSPKVLNQHHNDQTQPATSDFSRPPADENATTSAAVPVKNRKRNQRRRGQSRSSESSCVNDTHRTETEESEPGQSPQTRPGGASQRRRRKNKGPCVIQDGAADSDGASGSGQMPSKQPGQQPKQQRHRKRKPKLAVESLDLGHLQPTQGEEPLLVNAIAQNGAEQEKKKKKKKRNKPKTHVEERTEDGLIAVAATEKATLTKKMQSPLKKAKASQCQVQSSSSPGSASRGNRGGRRRRLFEDYMSVEDVSAGLKRGELIQGVLRINPKKYQDAFIPSPDGLADIFLDGFVARNRALNGDVVVVKLLPREQWKVLNGEESEQTPVKKQEGRPTASCSPDVIVEAQYNNGEEEEELVHQMKSVSLQEQGPATEKNEEHRNISSSSGIASDKTVQRTAKVVYIVEQKHSRAASGSIKFLPDKTFAMFSPVDHRVPRVNVPLSDCPADFPSRPGDYANTLFICRITHWPADNSFAEGRLAKSLGQAGEIEPETEGILTEYDVDFSEFSEEALACLPQTLPWTIPPEEFAKRKDLRKQCIFTIDPATARDLDDALSCTKLPDGNFEVGVHIADVSYFVEEASALDLVASQRATSVYLVQKVIPMLPRLLCEELCSLNPQTDRLAFSVIWTLSPEGKILSQWFGRSVIRSCVKLSYDHAQSMIEEPGKRFIPDELPPVSPEHSVQQVHEAVLHLHAIAKHLRAQRFESGALRLDQMKLAFTLDADMAMPQGCYIYQYRDSNKLVEEFMLLANMAVAHQIYSSYRTLALLRRHPTPQSRMMEVLQELCDQMGLNIDLSSAGALHRSLNESVGNDEYSTARKEVLTHMCSRPMQMAVYFCTGVLNDEKLFRHYALNVPLYTHFTSPIRRYADLIVHRLLAASLKCGPRFRMSEDEVQKQASHCNDKKMASKRVQELSSELFFSVFVRECGPLDSEAMVMGMLDKALDVLVLRYGVQKRIYCNAIEGLQSFNFRRVGKRPEMTLIWTPDDVGQDSIQQDISLFSLLHVQLKSDGVPLKYSAVLKRPAETQP